MLDRYTSVPLIQRFVLLSNFQAYQLWKDGKWHGLVDPALGNDFPVSEVVKCGQFALLCV
jgi:hypothetical protein